MKLKTAVFGAQGRMGEQVTSLIAAERKNFQLVDLDEADLVIDFSSPSGLRKLLKTLSKNPVALVSGTTGLNSGDHVKLKNYAKKAPVLWAPNLSLGVAVLKRSLQALKGLEGFDFQIEDIHHRHKKDAPSGTAKMLEGSLRSLGIKKLEKTVSVRAGGAPGLHRVWAIGEEEWICFEHMAFDRKVFARGALAVGTWLQRQGSGLYDLETYLEKAGQGRR